MRADAKFDVIVYGASGFTGRLVAEYLALEYGVDKDVKWAMAGRSAQKLADVRDIIKAPKDTPLVVADAADSASLDAMVKNAKCVLTTVGPYQLYGEALLASCVHHGTDYVDLCGEPTWMAQMIEKYGQAAKDSGARIVFSCGFDSLPFDLGVFYLEQQANEKFGHTLPHVKTRVRKMQGTFSGGTAASLGATMQALQNDPTLLQVAMNPFALADGFQGPPQPPAHKIIHDDDLGQWVAPFIMEPINSKNVHRSNALLGHEYGEDFTYNEMMATGEGERGKSMAEALASHNPMGGKDAPKPGEGPSKAEREAGHYDVLVTGSNDAGETLSICVTGDKDPGYGSTCKMIAQSALCLINDVPNTKGGIWTAAPAMGAPLIERLRTHAGLTFDVEAT
ncbi:MAG TPA: saccharopine dehydrogenase [Hellea balneolensis]|uniref:Saccharopine dehydrogenase n=1 Tax=Hellea balneolensis TaxID=287478 RepID=A0A7C3CC69_9PROT|nr:saccharopine dehydrogenase [Hellea balneolensis]